MLTFVIVILYMLVLIIMLYYLQPGYLIQHLILLRYPILCALSLLLLPLVAITFLPTFIANLFIVDDWFGFALVSTLAILCSWVIMFTSGLIIVGAPKRFGFTPPIRPKANFIVRVVYWLWQNPMVTEAPPPQSWRNFWGIWRYEFRKNFNYLAILFPFLLILSLLVNLYGQATFSWRLSAIISGVGVAFFVGIVVLTLLLLMQLCYDKLRDTEIWNSQKRRVSELSPKVDVRKVLGVQKAVDIFQDGYTDLDKTPFTHRRAIFLFLVAGLIYGVGYSLLNPAYPNFIVRHTPPLTYFIVLITLAALILPSLSYYFDRSRVPGVLIIIVVCSIIYHLLGTDHYYEFTTPTTLAAASTQNIRTPQDVVVAWDKRYQADQHPIMVVVAASGGGIKAATWTAQVMKELRNDPELGQPFAESITLVSTVSGGSVGGMYVLDQYRQPNLPLDKAVNQASESSLNAIAWGIAYPDLLRTIFPLNWLVGKINDRGSATEHAWRAQLAEEPTTLLTWPQTIEKQWQPLQVFNTTIAETGQRLLLSPIEIRSPFKITRFARAENFVTLYPGCDLSVVTAARLSATFPYVTPIARPSATETCAKDKQKNYHLADGGYYDNFGMMTVLEFLSALTPQIYQKQFQRQKILLVQIRASPLEDVEARVASADGFMYASFGPGLTALQVQTATQIGRNDLEFELLKQNWATDGVTIESVVFELRKEVALSWYLSAQEKQDIANEFSQGHNQISLKKLKQFWNTANLTEVSP